MNYQLLFPIKIIFKLYQSFLLIQPGFPNLRLRVQTRNDGNLLAPRLSTGNKELGEVSAEQFLFVKENRSHEWLVYARLCKANKYNFFFTYIRPEFILTADCNVRILGLVTLLDLQMLNECNSASLSSVVEHLLEINDKGSERNCRYFGNSPIHRIKQRIAQTLLLLQPHFTSVRHHISFSVHIFYE